MRGRGGYDNKFHGNVSDVSIGIVKLSFVEKTHFDLKSASLLDIARRVIGHSYQKAERDVGYQNMSKACI